MKIINQLKFIIFGCLFLLFGFMCLSTTEKSIVNERHVDIPCQNLDVLDSVDDILHWDEYERYMYIKNLENDNN